MKYLILMISLLGHMCKWELCPYKGIKEHEFKQCVLEYTECEEDDVAVSIDIIHLYYPTWEYEQIIEAIEND